MVYSSIEEAALHVLGKYCNYVNRSGTEYVIIGGWSAFLLNSKPIAHPGTKDVDILFREATTPYALAGIIELSISKGYLLSAKHPFQLFEILNVSDQEFVFNIDVMHPKEETMKELFLDQFDLTVFLDKERSKKAKAKSIIGPNSDILFHNLCCEPHIILFKDDDRQMKYCRIKIINELGCLLSKSVSCQKQKRERDSLDIFLSIKQARNYGKLIESIKILRKGRNEIFKALAEIRKAHEANILLPNIRQFITVVDDDYYKTLNNFFIDLD
ncbi:MAG: hypothetical protein NTU98_11195 [Bacteroidetes bacterium]|nr:hypothetical protein [Bacteroidota bacterium]